MDIILLLHSSARPKILFEVVVVSWKKSLRIIFYLIFLKDNELGNYLKVTPTSAITFPSAEYIRERIMKCHHSELGTDLYMVVIDCHRIHKIDFTAGKVFDGFNRRFSHKIISIYNLFQCLGALISDLKSNNRQVIFFEPRLKIMKILKNVCAKDMLIAETEEDLVIHLRSGWRFHLLY